MHIKIVILLGTFFHLVWVMLLICQQRVLFNAFLRFLFFSEKRDFNVLYSWGQRFLHLCIYLHTLCRAISAISGRRAAYFSAADQLLDIRATICTLNKQLRNNIIHYWSST